MPRNKALLEKGRDIQSQIDAWHIERKGNEHNHDEYKVFLEEIGYIAPRSGDFHITTSMLILRLKQLQVLN